MKKYALIALLTGLVACGTQDITPAETLSMTLPYLPRLAGKVGTQYININATDRVGIKVDGGAETMYGASGTGSVSCNEGVQSCTLSVSIAPGAHSLTVTSYAGATVISTKTVPIMITAGQANTLSVTLDPVGVSKSLNMYYSSDNSFLTLSDGSVTIRQTGVQTLQVNLKDAVGGNMKLPATMTVCADNSALSGTVNSGGIVSLTASGFNTSAAQVWVVEGANCADASKELGRLKLHAEGSLKWKAPITDGIVDGTRGSAAIAPDGTIYIGGRDSKLHAFSPDGTEKWAYTVGSYVQSAPAIALDGTVYFGSYDAKVYALHPDGTLKWSYTTGGNVISSPAIAADGTIYFGSGDNKVYALNPNGTLKGSCTTGGQIYASPAIGADGTVYVGSFDKKLYALDASGVPKWVIGGGATGAFDGSPAIGPDGTIYAANQDGKLYAFSPSGAKKWDVTIGTGSGAAVTLDASGNVYVGNNAGDLKKVSPSGSVLATFAGDGFASIVAGATITAGGDVYVGSLDGNLVGLTGSLSGRWSFQTSGRVQSSPALGQDGILYFGAVDDPNFYALYTTASGYASSSWPKFRKNNLNTGR